MEECNFSPSAALDEWLDKHPDKAMTIAKVAVKSLWLAPAEDRLLEEGEDFMSGADYIDEIEGASESVGLIEEIERIQKIIDENTPEESRDHDTEHIRMTEDEFIERFRPEVNENDEYYRQRDWTGAELDIDKAIKERRCWTATADDDGCFCIVEGGRMLNRYYNILTEKPWEDGKTYFIQNPEDKKSEMELS